MFDAFLIYVYSAERGIRSLQLLYSLRIVLATLRAINSDFSHPPRDALKCIASLLHSLTSFNHCGERGIRTPGRFSPTPPFQGGTLNRSAISPFVLTL